MIAHEEHAIIGLPKEIQIAGKSRKPKRKNSCNHWGVDKLYNAGVIDSDQHYACVHIRFWWECITSSHLKALSVESVRGGVGDMDGLQLHRYDAKSLMSKAVQAMHARELAEIKLLWAPCVWVAIDELTMTVAAARLGMRKNSGLERVQYAFTALYEELERGGLLFWQRKQQE